MFGSVVAAVWSVTGGLFSGSLATFIYLLSRSPVYLDSLIDLGCHFRQGALGQEFVNFLLDPNCFLLVSRTLSLNVLIMAESVVRICCMKRLIHRSVDVGKGRKTSQTLWGCRQKQAFSSYASSWKHNSAAELSFCTITCTSITAGNCQLQTALMFRIRLEWHEDSF